MRSDANIVVIGAGSASFGLETLSSIIKRKDLQKSTLHLVDINSDNLKVIFPSRSVVKITSREFSTKLL
jgi:alpha-galactosidase/6-phospho-beta-glucosidase family protein